MYCTRLTGIAGRKKSPSGHHRTTSSGYIFATKARIDNRKKNLLSSNISSTCHHIMVNFGPLAAEIISLVWGTTANFNGFRILISLLQPHRSPEANQTLHDVRPSPGLLHCIYIFGGSCPWRNFSRCKVHFPSNSFSSILLYLQHYCTALDQWASAKLCGMVQGMELQDFCRWHQLYSAGWPSRWALAHILVRYIFQCNSCFGKFQISGRFRWRRFYPADNWVSLTEWRWQTVTGKYYS